MKTDGSTGKRHPLLYVKKQQNGKHAKKRLFDEDAVEPGGGSR